MDPASEWQSKTKCNKNQQKGLKTEWITLISTSGIHNLSKNLTRKTKYCNENNSNPIQTKQTH